ncbi:MAG: hypothetical protein CM1200mP2_51450 [Planctomycetaceae bacterium]|nr:MAG: hypothetical protein CM1200mP2_51450 [Planctomycetaceae bacterium]
MTGIPDKPLLHNSRDLNRHASGFLSVACDTAAVVVEAWADDGSTVVVGASDVGQLPVGRDVYSPLSARMSPGLVARWSAQAGRSGSPRSVYFQPVEVRLVDTGPAAVAV